MEIRHAERSGKERGIERASEREGKGEENQVEKESRERRARGGGMNSAVCYLAVHVRVLLIRKSNDQSERGREEEGGGGGGAQDIGNSISTRWLRETSARAAKGETGIEAPHAGRKSERGGREEEESRKGLSSPLSLSLSHAIVTDPRSRPHDGSV